MQPEASPRTFVVRVTHGEAGGLRGTVERVRTGEKHRFRSVAELTAILERLAGRVESLPLGGRAGLAARPD